MIPFEDSIIIVQDELVGVRAWADRHKLSFTWLPDQLELRLKWIQPETQQEFFLKGIFDGYRAVPPAWLFCDDQWSSTQHSKHFPKLSQSPFGSPIFIKTDNFPLICVPFNRLAYAKHQGPHPDWGDTVNWINAGGTYVKAHYLADMLQVIYRDFNFTHGRME